mgnify:CR=1 FL=1
MYRDRMEQTMSNSIPLVDVISVKPLEGQVLSLEFSTGETGEISLTGMIAKGGASLLEGSAVAVLKEVLIPLATLVTPNLPEAEVLTGRKIADVEGQKAAADALLGHGCEAVLVKGGHLPGDLIFDVLATQETIHIFSSPRIDTRHTHGTGCTLASAIAALLAQGIELAAAVATARDYVHEAIRTAPGFGKGHGPLNFLAAIEDEDEDDIPLH